MMINIVKPSKGHKDTVLDAELLKVICYIWEVYKEKRVNLVLKY